MTQTTVKFSDAQVVAARRYVSRVRNAAKREYADLRFRYLLNGGPEPGRGTLSCMGEQAVRWDLNTILYGNQFGPPDTDGD